MGYFYDRVSGCSGRWITSCGRKERVSPRTGNERKAARRDGGLDTVAYLRMRRNSRLRKKGSRKAAKIAEKDARCFLRRRDLSAARRARPPADPPHSRLQS